ncbi:MAG: hypothetical protein IJ160_13665 [Muribaculaceae bacterium]|nr:hypothetical protein [Muribaculaceae bacterium]
MNKVIIALMGLIMIAATGCNQVGSSAGQPGVDSVAVNGIMVDSSRYIIVLYHDNTGDFFAPGGGRICGLELQGGRKEPMTLKLTSKILFLGRNTDEISLSRDRLFANYSDYLKYYNDYYPDTTLGVPIEKFKKDGVDFFSLSLNDGQIEKFDRRKHTIGPNQNNVYTMIVYDDNSGHLFDCDGTHICAVKERSTTIEDASFRLSKKIDVYSESTDELLIYENKLYLSFSDIQNDRYPSINTGYSKYKAMATKTDEGDAVIYHFSKTAAPAEKLAEDDGDETFSTHADISTSSVSAERWTGATSIEELKGKLDGTYWHLEDRNGMMRKFHFSRGGVTMYVGIPSDGKWFKQHRYSSYQVEMKRDSGGNNFVAVLFGNDEESIENRGFTIAFAKKCMVVVLFHYGEPLGQLKYGDYSWSDEL